MSAQIQILDSLEQGTAEWLALRKTKITATDASVILGSNPWKTRLQLYNEKIHENHAVFVNDAMKRGTELEPIARDLFNLKTGWNMKPTILVKEWAMASLDGRDEESGCIVEIKCPGEKDHALAIAGKVPDHYYPQLQHQMFVAETRMVYYFSFDGIDGVMVKVKRDDEYIEKMIAEEKKFYDCLINKTPPEPCERDYVEITDEVWHEYAQKWKEVTNSIKQLEKEEDELRKQLIFLSGENNSRGAGITLTQVSRKGNIDYTAIPELQNVDLEKYRKQSINTWRITTKTWRITTK